VTDAEKVVLRRCSPADVDAVARFVESCPPLDLHTSFTYWVTFEYWGNLCFVALEDEQIVGYASAIGSGRDDGAFYLWQIGVAVELRSTGLAQRLIDAVVGTGRESGFRQMQVSIAPENEASLRAFRRFASSLGSSLERCGEVSFTDSGGKPVHEDVYALAIV
jgi:L-2,4-diaminobutyric acid acetyltransferase